ncbi:Heterokaryon incompatibility protein 6, OR allele [Daldinia childiae]|uniref:Heterokaryon incompatibility protein 6, OR allele n=1 Tax=Daldinia childiae TaxID=326645 RepID=UPI0014452038|nr:Heterokaryon incompatibility protein 6, OR allele [Daldinia childiae]KAF3058506.1 Heterokaryon incompatibility protein 6, OR allele [Daldinia childiae]
MSKTIVCNNTRLSVAENLFNCLTQLEKNGHHYDRDLWVDAICIDQGNDHERNDQVSIMADIYRLAECVIVWLGAADELTQKASELIERLSQLTDDEMLTIDPQAFNNLHKNVPLGCSNSSGHWKALALLFGRRWFTRAWVVQELILARGTTILCGDFTLDWEKMVRASDFLSRRTSANTFKEHLFDGIDHALLSYKNPTKLNAVKRDINIGADNIILHTLVRCRTYDAEKKHDKVYSLLGLANCPSYDHPELYPNYNESVTKLYTDVAKYILKVSKDLHVLAHAEGDDFKQTKGLPTWVPDWSVREDLGLRITGYTRYNAAGTLPCFKKIQDENKLVLRGFELDTITRIGETKKEVNRTKNCKNWLEMRDELQREYPTTNYKDAFWRTLLIDTDPSRTVPIKQPWENAFDIWMELSDYEPSETDKHRAAQYETSFTHSLNLRLFRTAGGSLGCGTSSCEKGDLVWIVQGSRVPLILRKVPQAATYDLVGGTYLHGFMQGEALDGREFQEFTLS